ncbi:hypothetical protein EB118_21260 [bacterium]|nr:hypothetical protein [bacterium]
MEILNAARLDSNGASWSAPIVGYLVRVGPYLVRTWPRLLCRINGGVLCGGGWQVVTIPLMHLDSCTLPTREGDEARILALASVTRYGPAYDRGVAENLGKYMLMVNKQDSTSAEYFLDRAEKAYEYARERKIK